jgi:hypothetical protein
MDRLVPGKETSCVGPDFMGVAVVACGVGVGVFAVTAVVGMGHVDLIDGIV